MEPPTIPPAWSLPEAVPNLAMLPRQRDNWIVAARIATCVAAGFGLSLIALLGSARQPATSATVEAARHLPAIAATPLVPHSVIGRIVGGVRVLTPALVEAAERPFAR